MNSPGTYREVEFKIEPLLADEGATPTFDDVRSQGASLIVDGSIDGQRFVFSARCANASRGADDPNGPTDDNDGGSGSDDLNDDH